MALRIPEAHKKSVAAIADLADDKVASLATALRDAPPAITPRQLAFSIREQVGLPIAELTAIISVLLSLTISKNHHKRTASEIADDLAAEAAKERLGGIEPGSEKQALLKARVESLISVAGSLEITSRVADVYFAHDTLFKSARVLSDVRSIFPEGDTSAPVAGMIVHNLELSVHRSGRSENQYIALNIHDLRELRRVVDRAIEKDAALKRLIIAAGSKYIEDVPDLHQQ